MIEELFGKDAKNNISDRGKTLPYHLEHRKTPKFWYFRDQGEKISICKNFQNDLLTQWGAITPKTSRENGVSLNPMSEEWRVFKIRCSAVILWASFGANALAGRRMRFIIYGITYRKSIHAIKLLYFACSFFLFVLVLQK